MPAIQKPARKLVSEAGIGLCFTTSSPGRDGWADGTRGTRLGALITSKIHSDNGVNLFQWDKTIDQFRIILLVEAMDLAVVVVHFRRVVH